GAYRAQHALRGAERSLAPALRHPVLRGCTLSCRNSAAAKYPAPRRLKTMPRGPGYRLSRCARGRHDRSEAPQSSTWLTMPSASLGSNQVDLGGMMPPASETAIRSSMLVG